MPDPNENGNEFGCLIIIVIFIILALVLFSGCRLSCSRGVRSSEGFPSGANGLDGRTVLSAGVAGPLPQNPMDLFYDPYYDEDYYDEDY